MKPNPAVEISSPWKLLFRGAMGGLLALVTVLIYVYSTSDSLDGLPVAVLLAAANGTLVGTAIWLISRRAGRDLGALSGIVVGTAFSFCSSLLYLLFAAPVYGDLKQFLSKAIFLALIFGGVAGAVTTVSPIKTFAKDQREESARDSPPPSWSYLWRGAVGGLLGLFFLFAYRLYTNPYLLGGLFPSGAFVALIDGLLVGAVIFSLSRLLRGNPGLLWRVAAGTLSSSCFIAIYSYVEGALSYSDFKALVRNSIVVGVMFGAPAGALANPKPDAVTN
jgi:hypothetical protein